MSWDSEHVPLHRGRHRSPRPDQVGRALRRALVATVLPALALGLLGWVFVKADPDRVLRVALDPGQFRALEIVVVIVCVLWIALICGTYVRHRAVHVSTPFRLAGVAGVLVMCAAVVAPVIVVAPDANAHISALVTVFNNERSATTPKVTVANPWGKRRRVNVLLLGGDGAVHRDGIRTDSVILASIDTRTGQATLFSLPRNLEKVPFKPGSPLAAAYPNGFTEPGHETEYLLNAIYKYVPEQHPGILGRTDNLGADAVKLGVSGALGIPVDYYVLVNLAGFSKIVDAMGGITVNVNQPVPIGGNTTLNIQPDSYIQPGPNEHLDGFKALWYTRGRFGSTDYSRMERQRCALNAIVATANPLSLFRHYASLARTAKKIIRTDIPRKLLPAFVDLALKVKGKPIRSVGFERSGVFDPNNPDFTFVHAAVQAALHPKKKARTGAKKPPSTASNTKDDCAYHPVSGTAE
ncbi:MAG: cell envelope-related transcriptional attenuator [Marmoricola sp.]|nr:cell envelope-related transcriptional attenuator [Marmoricola sp.]